MMSRLYSYVYRKKKAKNAAPTSTDATGAERLRKMLERLDDPNNFAGERSKILTLNAMLRNLFGVFIELPKR